VLISLSHRRRRHASSKHRAQRAREQAASQAHLPNHQGTPLAPPVSHPQSLTGPRTQLKPAAVAEYKALHAPGAGWPGVLAALAAHHITQYSIHHYAPLALLVAHFVYTGADYAADMAAVAADPETRRWWALTDAMQESFQPDATGSGQAVPWWTVSAGGLAERGVG
jgi:L-rhamnose mutarotase